MELNIVSKIRFYLSLIIFKLIAPFECRNYRLTLFLAEIIFPFQRMIDPSIINPKKYQEIILKTRFGNFRIRKILIDLIIASPSFEKLDLMELIRRISKSLDVGSKVLFMDIGANFGKYTVAVGNYCKKYNSKLQIISFEPEVISFQLLKANIKLNKLTNVSIFNKALSNKIGLQNFYLEETMNMFTSSKMYSSKSVKISTQKLDKYIPYLKSKYDEVFIKLDVEGHEMAVLQGSQKFLDIAKKVILLIEDSSIINGPNLEKYLRKKWNFVSKTTSYNSFWEYKKIYEVV